MDTDSTILTQLIETEENMKLFLLRENFCLIWFF